LFAALGLLWVAVLGLTEISSSAAASTEGELQGAMAQISITAPSEVALSHERSQIVLSGLWPTHTVFLPAIYKGSWQVPDSPFGVQMYANHMEQDVVMKAAAAGVRWVRVPFSWSQVEPQNTTPENYQWPSAFDDWLARLSARGIKPILTLGGNPAWASPLPGGPITRTAIISELVEFVEAAVAHYSGSPYGVKHWEFYNEPDNGDPLWASKGFGYWGREPAAYATMLRAVYGPIKAIDPEAQIILGGLAYDWFSKEGGPFVEGFLDGVLQNGGGAYFDLMNFHYYPVFRVNWDPDGPGLVGKAKALRLKLAEHGLNKPFICTEMGTWSEEGDNRSRELQSRSVTQLFAQGLAADLLVGIWFTAIDGNQLEPWKWGLLDSDLNPKPAYFAYRTAVQQLATASHIGLLGTQESGSEEIEAHRFLTADGSAWIVVAWTNDDQDHSMIVDAPRLVVVDKYGVETLIRDDDDGQMDGYVEAIIGPSPIYVRYSR
jgi:hypothetical protein